MGKDFDKLGPIDVSKEKFQELPLSVLQSAIMPVIVIEPDSIALIGTAFNVAPAGVLITARHVVEEAFERCRQWDGAYIAVLWMASGAEYDDVSDLLGGPIRVVLAQINQNHDVAILQIQGATNNGEPFKYPAIGIDTSLPPTGPDNSW